MVIMSTVTRHVFFSVTLVFTFSFCLLMTSNRYTATQPVLFEVYPENRELEVLKEDPKSKWRQWNIMDDPSRIEVQGDHGIVKFAVRPKNWGSSDKTREVCLATQSTLYFLYHVIEVSDQWRSRMSVTVYVSGMNFARAKVFIWVLRGCSSVLRDNVAFHFVFSFEDLPVNDQSIWEKYHHENCFRLKAFAEELHANKTSIDYPQNLMRNMAREGCDTDHIILADNDMLPSPGLAPALQTFLQNQTSCHKCAFVLPVYELSFDVALLPRTKQQLLKLVKGNFAQPYHWKAWPPNQGSHEPKKWEQIPFKSEDIRIAYPILTYHLFYEPIFVAKNPIPRFEERFTGYGYTRSSQVFQMIVEGYKFYLLDNVFFLHRGLKKNHTNPKYRHSEIRRNFGIFFEFAKYHLKKRGVRKSLLDAEDQKDSWKKSRLESIISSLDNFN